MHFFAKDGFGFSNRLCIGSYESTVVCLIICSSFYIFLSRAQTIELLILSKGLVSQPLHQPRMYKLKSLINKVMSKFCRGNNLGVLHIPNLCN